MTHERENNLREKKPNELLARSDRLNEAIGRFTQIPPASDTSLEKFGLSRLSGISDPTSPNYYDAVELATEIREGVIERTIPTLRGLKKTIDAILVEKARENVGSYTEAERDQLLRRRERLIAQHEKGLLPNSVPLDIINAQIEAAGTLLETADTQLESANSTLGSVVKPARFEEFVSGKDIKFSFQNGTSTKFREGTTLNMFRVLLQAPRSLYELFENLKDTHFGKPLTINTVSSYISQLRTRLQDTGIIIEKDETDRFKLIFPESAQISALETPEEKVNNTIEDDTKETQTDFLVEEEIVFPVPDGTDEEDYSSKEFESSITLPGGEVIDTSSEIKATLIGAFLEKRHSYGQIAEMAFGENTPSTRDSVESWILRISAGDLRGIPYSIVEIPNENDETIVALLHDQTKQSEIRTIERGEVSAHISTKVDNENPDGLRPIEEERIPAIDFVINNREGYIGDKVLDILGNDRRGRKRSWSTVASMVYHSLNRIVRREGAGIATEIELEFLRKTEELTGLKGYEAVRKINPTIRRQMDPRIDWETSQKILSSNLTKENDESLEGTGAQFQENLAWAHRIAISETAGKEEHSQTAEVQKAPKIQRENEDDRSAIYVERLRAVLENLPADEPDQLQELTPEEEVVISTSDEKVETEPADPTEKTTVIIGRNLIQLDNNVIIYKGKRYAFHIPENVKTICEELLESYSDRRYVEDLRLIDLDILNKQIADLETFLEFVEGQKDERIQDVLFWLEEKKRFIFELLAKKIDLDRSKSNALIVLPSEATVDNEITLEEIPAIVETHIERDENRPTQLERSFKEIDIPALIEEQIAIVKEATLSSGLTSHLQFLNAVQGIGPKDLGEAKREGLVESQQRKGQEGYTPADAVAILVKKALGKQLNRKMRNELRGLIKAKMETEMGEFSSK